MKPVAVASLVAEGYYKDFAHMGFVAAFAIFLAVQTAGVQIVEAALVQVWLVVRLVAGLAAAPVVGLVAARFQHYVFAQ